MITLTYDPHLTLRPIYVEFRPQTDGGRTWTSDKNMKEPTTVQLRSALDLGPMLEAHEL